MADEQNVYCPLCGNVVPPGLTKCPVCATELQKVKSRRSRESFGAPKPTDDYLHRDIPKVDLPKSKLACPLCAMELKGGESRCPRCGIPLAAQREMLECPECGSFAPANAKACPKCGVGFEEGPVVPVPPAPEEVPPPPLPFIPPVKEPPIREPVPQPEIVTALPVAKPVSKEGFVNGRGAVNGNGLAGPRGATNGTGLVNGTGISSGSRGEGQMPGLGKRQTMSVRRWQFLAVLVAIAVIIPTFVFLSYSKEQAPVSVDGDFGEWASVQKFGMYTPSSSAQINVDQWATEVQGNKVFLYVRVQASIMGTADVSSFYLFIDNDNSASSGYVVSGIGADYLVELDGWDGSVRSTAVYEYGSTTEHYDWNSWSKIESASASVSGTQLEASADLPVAVGASAKFMLLSKDSFDRNALSYPVPRAGGLLIIKQEPGPAVQGTGIIASSSGVALLRLTLSCEGSSGTIDSLAPTITGAVSSFVSERITLGPGDEPVVDVTVSTASSASGSLVEAYMSASGVVSSFAGVRVVGEHAKAYVTAAPSAIQVDGAFADWAGRTTPDSDSISVGNENVDIGAVGAVNTTTSSSFYVSVLGDMLGGSYVPIVVTKPTGDGGGGIIIPALKTGEDVLRVYVDSDMSTGTGYLMAAGSKIVGADYLVEVKGLDGEIRSKALYSFVSGHWSAVSGAAVLAGNDRQQIELSVSSSSLSGSSSIDYVVETTDWRARADVASSVPMPSRSAANAFATSPGIDTWVVDGSTTSASATSMSYQRKLFYDGVNFWSLYWDGTNTIARYSTDAGRTWSATSRVFVTAGVNEASVWFDSSTNVAYAVGDRSVASRNIYVQRGIVSPATSTITWSATDRTLAASSASLGSKHTFISKDSSGYIWVVSSNCTQTLPTRYDLSVFRSSAVDSVASWVYRGNMLDADDTQPTLKGSVVPVGSGSDMWAVYGYAGNVGARKFTGTWSAQTTIYTIGSGNAGNTENAPPCALVDSRGVVHVVYGNGHEQSLQSKPFIYYVYNSGGSWSAPYRLDTAGNNEGNFYPTISLDSSTDRVYAFWILTDSSAIGLTVVGKKNTSGTWSLLAFDPQTADQKQYLTSIYSAPGENLICWQWTQNNTAPIQVIFDRIPEFSHLVLPAFFVLAICVVALRRTRARRE